MRSYGYIGTMLCAASSTLAHMEMSYPYPFRSRFNPNETNADYDNTAPLLTSGSNFPCKGYHTNGPREPFATFRAGDVAHMTLAGSATHSGGSCQMSLSYDGGRTFRVILSMIGGCPLPQKYDVSIPSFAPNGNALLAWTWFNLVGNREMYMNCAPIAIEGGSSGSDQFDRLPEIFVGNVGNGCSTTEGRDTVFAAPGDNVVWGGNPSPGAPTFPIC